jgi:Xaa-Pro dipeptidase
MPIASNRFSVSEGTGPLVDPLPFSKSEYEGRLASIRKAMNVQGVDAIISFTPENIYYLTGHDTPGYYFYQACIVTHGELPLNVLRRIETTNTLWRSWSRRVVSYQDRDDPIEATIAALDQIGVTSKRIGLEVDSFFITPKKYAALRAEIEKRGGEVVDSQLIEPLRVIKSKAEIDYIRRGARIAEKAMKTAIEASAEGMTEDQVAGAMMKTLVEAGGEYAGLPPFVTSGPRSSVCHTTWNGRKFERGDVIALELPGVVKRYAATLFRCGTVGPAPDDVKRLADACISSLEAAIAAIRPGALSEEVHAASAGNFQRKGFGEFHGHRTGYSVGINYPPDWGEGQIMSLWANDKRPLQPGMTFHLVPGVAIPRKYLVNISETVLVTETGCEPITNFPRELFVA